MTLAYLILAVGYNARESVLHTLREMDRWLETHVKDAPPRTATSNDN